MKQRNEKSAGVREEGSKLSPRREAENGQPSSAIEDAPGYGNKKLDGPNRPST